MTNSNNRDKCVICGNKKLNEIFNLHNMPVFMGVNKTNNTYYHNMTFESCDVCDNVQIKEVIDPEILYMDNHNIEIIGKTWSEHYEKFVLFLEKYIIDKNVLEIGDPSCKISSFLSDKSKIWNIVEINPNPKVKKPKNVIFINKYFDEFFSTEIKPDVIIHSHFLEHSQNPIVHLNFTNKLLSEEGRLIFSVPNFGEILNVNSSPNNILHFEHTYFFDKDFMCEILNFCGFEVVSIEEYKNHSLFFNCKKSKKIHSIPKHSNNVSEKFKEKYNFYLKKIEYINNKIIDYDSVYLYGCHISSQFLINIGLNVEKVSSILDNSTTKQTFKIYGSDLVTKSPNVISNDLKPVVIVSHMGIYTDEISEQLKKINKEVILL